MDEPEKIPLGEAVSRGVIPCGRCGQPGAEVRELGGKKHFICPRCAGRPRLWVALLLGVALSLFLLAVWLTSTGDPGEDMKTVLAAIEAELREGKAENALSRARATLKEHPQLGSLHCMAGQALLQLRRSPEAVHHFRKALDKGGEASELCVFGLGRALALSNRAAESLDHLERPFTDPVLELSRKRTLAEAYLEVGRYEDSLRLLDLLEPDLIALQARFRALSYLGKTEEALGLLASLPADDPQARVTGAILRASQEREGGAFDAAENILKKALAGEPDDSPARLRLRRSLLALYVEAGKTDLLIQEAERLASEARASYVTQAMWYRAMGLLLAGRQAEAKAAAKAFLERVPSEYAPFRQERLMMSHLAGEASVDGVAEEAAATSRVRANDLYFYLAAATGERKWAQQALESTPKHNFPYHAIQRFLKE